MIANTSNADPLFGVGFAGLVPSAPSLAGQVEPTLHPHPYCGDCLIPFDHWSERKSQWVCVRCMA